MGAITHNGEVLQSLPANASQINFDNDGTDLSATQTENAIKEVNAKANANADDITQLKSGLDNVMKVPNQDSVVLGYAQKDGTNPVVVNLGNNNIQDYDFLEFMTAYYNSGVACYGYVNVPLHTMKLRFSSDTGVTMFTTCTIVGSVGAIRVLLDTTNNSVKFIPINGIEPEGNYYVVCGVKLRK